MPLASAGEEATGPPVLNVHTSAPVAAFSAWTTAGVDSTGPPSDVVQRVVSVDGAAVSKLARVCAASKPNDCQFAEHAESATPNNAEAATTRPRREATWWREFTVWLRGSTGFLRIRHGPGHRFGDPRPNDGNVTKVSRSRCTRRSVDACGSR